MGTQLDCAVALVAACNVCRCCAASVTMVISQSLLILHDDMPLSSRLSVCTVVHVAKHDVVSCCAASVTMVISQSFLVVHDYMPLSSMLSACTAAHVAKHDVVSCCKSPNGLLISYSATPCRILQGVREISSRCKRKKETDHPSTW